MRLAMRLALLDVSSLLRRFYHGRPADVVSGVNLNAVRGLEGLIRSFQSGGLDYTHVAACWDSERSVRKSINPLYKADRDPPPADYVAQLPVARALLDWFEVPSLQVDGFEADDVIASAVAQVGRRCPVGIFSEDFDLKQCLSDDNWVVLERKSGSVGPFTGLLLLAEDRIFPDQYVEWKALVDVVERVGEKSASDLLERFGSIAKIYLDGLDTFTEKRREAFETSAEKLYAWCELIRLKANLRLPKFGAAAKISLVKSAAFWEPEHVTAAAATGAESQ